MTNYRKIKTIFKIANPMLHHVLLWIINIEPKFNVHFKGDKFFISGHEWNLKTSRLSSQSDSFIDFLYTVYLQNQK